MRKPKAISDRESALAFLFGHIDYERTPKIPYASRRFKLDRMRKLLSLLGDPQRQLKILHVAGTKGKGSTASMIAAMLQACGYSVGLYTSPHLERLEERFQVDGQLCSPAEFVQLVERVRVAVAELEKPSARDQDGESVTYFELTTAVALLHFAQRQVDLAVLEVGLGGRLDSTNVCQPLVSVITSISRDHTQQLGGTLAAIAAEKAGIIKPRTPVISGVVQPSPAEVIQQAADQQQAPLMILNRDFGFHYQGTQKRQPPEGPEGLETRIDYWDPRIAREEWQDLRLGLLGRHQAANASVALATVFTLPEIRALGGQAAIRRGLRAAHCPARIEILGQDPPVILDAAHNVASIDALLGVILEAFPAPRRLLVFATSVDKSGRQMLAKLVPHFHNIVLTRYHSNPRWTPPQRLAEMAQEILGQSLSNHSISLADEPSAAWRMAKAAAGQEALICITGSFFLAAEIRPHIVAQPAGF